MISLKNEFGKPKNLWKKNKGISDMLSIDIGIVSHCNLNCKGCNHFSPIIPEEFISLEEFESDIRRLAVLLSPKIRKIGLLGGEPLLHPQIAEFVRLSREVFPKQEIEILTNGLLLDKQSEAFWRNCRECNVSIEITRYPINFDYKKIMRDKKSGVDIRFYGRSRYVEKTLFKLPLDLDGKQNKEESFLNCYMGGNCITLYHGRLYPCSYAAYIGWFNQKFGQNLQIEADDFVDIYQEQCLESIIDKLTHSIPFCRYCAATRNEYGMKWTTSKREMGEWSL